MTIKVFLQKISSCTANFTLDLKTMFLKPRSFSQIFVKICKNSKFFENQHAALVPFAKTPQKLSLQKFSRKTSIQLISGQKKTIKSVAFKFWKSVMINIRKRVWNEINLKQAYKAPLSLHLVFIVPQRNRENRFEKNWANLYRLPARDPLSRARDLLGECDPSGCPFQFKKYTSATRWGRATCWEFLHQISPVSCQTTSDCFKVAGRLLIMKIHGLPKLEKHENVV